MTTNILTVAVALSDQDLLTRIDALAAKERQTSAELVAHLAALELRPSLYAAKGYGSLFAYCTQALRLSEDATCNRIQAARACRRFPEILDLLASGSLTLASIRMLKPHLTAANHETVLARAVNRTREEIEALVAELAPRPDAPASIRRLPLTKSSGEIKDPGSSASGLAAPAQETLPQSASAFPQSISPTTAPAPIVASTWRGPEPSLLSPSTPTHRPIVRASAPHRYRVQFTIGQEAHDKLRRVQTLLRRENPNGDAGVIFELALELLLEKVEKAKLGTGARARSKPVIRPGTDKAVGPPQPGAVAAAIDRRLRPREGTSRYIPREVRRAVWWRDAGQCAFVSAGGQRCMECSFLELHHIQPYALEGPATVGNISLRCRRHNQYEAELVFGPHVATRMHSLSGPLTPVENGHAATTLDRTPCQ